MAATEFSQSKFQEVLTGRLVQIQQQGHGDHRNRSIKAAHRQAQAELLQIGYSEEEARSIIRDCKDMAALALGAE